MFCTFDASKASRADRWIFSDVMDPAAAKRLLRSNAHNELRKQLASEFKVYELRVGDPYVRQVVGECDTMRIAKLAAKGDLGETQILNKTDGRVVPILDNCHEDGFLVSFFRGAEGIICLIDWSSTGPDCYTVGDMFMSVMGVWFDVECACAACNRPIDGRLKCGHCRGVRYCSRECQKAHWAEHKSCCLKAK